MKIHYRVLHAQHTRTYIIATPNGERGSASATARGKQKSPPPEVKGGEPMETLIAVAQGVLAGLLTEGLLALARAVRKAVVELLKR